MSGCAALVVCQLTCSIYFECLEVEEEEGLLAVGFFSLYTLPDTHWHTQPPDATSTFLMYTFYMATFFIKISYTLTPYLLKIGLTHYSMHIQDLR